MLVFVQHSAWMYQQACQLQLLQANPTPLEEKTHQEARFNKLEEGSLHVNSCHSSLANHVEAVAHCKCLLQPIAPVQRVLLQ